jgi:ABC-type dipeptide/oligopeptide/nickel transport system permease component
LFGLIMAERGRERLPAQPLNALGEAFNRTVAYTTNHPTTYYWHKEDAPVGDVVGDAFGKSAGLLVIALGIAIVLGLPLGISAALARRGPRSAVVIVLSILGVSIPSFMLAMILWIASFELNRRGVLRLPPTGFGWDAHMVMPALVLATRPLAQIAQVTYVTLANVLGEDFIRTARSKGLRQRVVLVRHALRNALVPIITTLGTSLRFSLASLPVVELFFLWPGVGLTLFQAIELDMTLLVTDMIVALGLLFLLINLLLELIYLIIDPRLRAGGQATERHEQHTWRERWADFKAALATWWADVRHQLGVLRRRPAQLAPLPVPAPLNGDVGVEGAALASRSSRRRILHSIFGNPALILGGLMVVGLMILAVRGEMMTTANPYRTHGVMRIDGEIGGPPFPPSSTFPWGTDPVGRDIQALVLSGAKLTLTIALFGMLARMALGTFLGILAGWWPGSGFDRLVTSGIATWAAFPATLFAMILVLALGIQQGMWVFIVALGVVGWGEIAQFVRGQVMSIRPQPYIEAAHAVGAGAGRMLSRHVMPNLLPALVILAVLEMGGVLMLLAELGFLNIFMGGGFRVSIAEQGAMQPVHYAFSDVPEWGALLANIRNWWRAYWWMGWFPAIFFSLAILAFNLWGEGLRRFLDESRINVSRLFNRYTALSAVLLVFGLGWVLQSVTPLGLYKRQAEMFDAQRALADIEALASARFAGRETGTPGSEAAAYYIADRMKAVGLLPAGTDNTYLQVAPSPRFHLSMVPRLELLDAQDNVVEALAYRQDFVEYVGPLPTYGEGEGTIVGLALGADPETPGTDVYRLGDLPIEESIVIVRAENVWRMNTSAAAGVLVIADDPDWLARKYLYGRSPGFRSPTARSPVMAITPELADRLLQTAGSSLAHLDALKSGLGRGATAVTGAGAKLRMAITGTLTPTLGENYYNVIGYLPGTDSATGLDSHAIIVSAYFDGLGTGPDGTLYPGANDNASGVAAMLEIARAMKQGPYQPKKTILFVAWSGGERYESLSTFDIMNAKIGFHNLQLEAVIELSGVGAGDGAAIALGEGSSFRLVQLYQAAAARLGVATTTRGRDPHYDLPARPGFGGRSALSLYASWDGSDASAHHPGDTVATIDPDKLRQSGQTTLLALSVISREVDY